MNRINRLITTSSGCTFGCITAKWMVFVAKNWVDVSTVTKIEMICIVICSECISWLLNAFFYYTESKNVGSVAVPENKETKGRKKRDGKK